MIKLVLTVDKTTFTNGVFLGPAGLGKFLVNFGKVLDFQFQTTCLTKYFNHLKITI